MFNPDSDSAEEAIAAALGLDSAYGYHIERAVQPAQGFRVGRSEDGSRFRCIADDRTYWGCGGRYCEARYCWAGNLVRSARYAMGSRPQAQRCGARCHTCGHICVDHHSSDKPGEELLTCMAGHFEFPITGSCLAIRGIPSSAPTPCVDYWPAEAMRAEVVAWRKRHRAAGRGGEVCGGWGVLA